MRNDLTHHSAVVASPAAHKAITTLRHARGPVMFVQSAGHPGTTAPMCVPAGKVRTGGPDVLLGEIDGCPFYIDAALYEGWHRPRLVLDVEPGLAEGFSLPAAPGMHFVVWSPHPGELSALPEGTTP
jgi:uncharacterized protein (DUF779 family)